MAEPINDRNVGWPRWRPRLDRNLVLLLMPLALIVAHMLGGERALLLTAFAYPLFLALGPIAERAATGSDRDALTGLPARASLAAALQSWIAGKVCGPDGNGCTAMAIEIDDFLAIEERHDRATVEQVLRVVADRLTAIAGAASRVTRLDGARFAIALAPGLDLTAAMQVGGRVQSVISEPIGLGSVKVQLTASTGFALASRSGASTGEALLQEAVSAMIEAQRSGPGAIRSYSEGMRRRIAARDVLIADAVRALERGDLQPFFQPQVRAADGRISGMEALARWHHPERGLISPAEFLPALEQAGLLGRLGETMLARSLEALKHWDARGLDIPRVGVNISGNELGEPHLVQRISWELDRQDIPPGRLVVEVLETVVATRRDDIVIQNLSGLARLGCRLDLDDFGTGHASITSIRRFSIERIKIDRSFVTRIDQDEDQQRMVAAILTMADNLGLETLAEGVETPAEREKLRELGCGHLQGFGIARPMPLADADAWIAAHKSRATAPIALVRTAV